MINIHEAIKITMRMSRKIKSESRNWENNNLFIDGILFKRVDYAIMASCLRGEFSARVENTDIEQKRKIFNYIENPENPSGFYIGGTPSDSNYVVILWGKEPCYKSLLQMVEDSKVN